MSHGSFSDIGDPAASEIDEVVQTDQNGHGSSEDDTVQPADVLEERKSKLNTLFGFLPWDLPLSRAAAETAPPPDPGEGPFLLEKTFLLLFLHIRASRDGA
jgi:hypothetical protein